MIRASKRTMFHRALLWIPLAALSLCHAAPHPSLPGPVVPEGLGVNIHFTDPAEGEMELLAGAGFRWVRMDFTWSATERECGVYDFSAYDRLAGHLEQHGIKALFILDYSNRLYETDSSVRTAAGREAFARWAAAAAKRYQGRGYLWEIWNEPNISFWKPEPNAADYSALANAASAAIRKAAPGEAVIGPATSGIDLAFLEACFNNRTLDGWDAVSVHPYRQSAPETAVPEYGKLRQLIRRHAPADRQPPVLSGEWGYSAAWKGYDEDAQGRMLARQFLTNLANHIPLSIWYDWRDDGPDPKEPEHHFGTVGLPETSAGKTTFRLKPAYHAARTLSATLAGHRFVRRLAVGDSEDHALLFSKGNARVVACWTTSGQSRQLEFPADDAGCQMTGHLGGDASRLGAKNGKVAVAATDAPRYLIFDRTPAALETIPAMPDFRCDLVRLPDAGFVAQIENPDGRPIEGVIRLTGIPNPEETRLSLAAGQTSAQIHLKHPARNGLPDPTGIEILSHGQRIMAVTAPRSLSTDPGLFARCFAKSDGDAQVAATQKLAPHSGKPPFGTAPVWELKCRFDPGWRYVTVEPKEPVELPGRPRSFGFWVFGDASGAALRLRVKDAKGRTWQPDGGEITWKGWRHVRMRLGPGTAHWGGSGEAVIEYPLRWEAPLLVDNVSRRALECGLLVTAPTLEE